MKQLDLDFSQLHHQENKVKTKSTLKPTKKDSQTNASWFMKHFASERLTTTTALIKYHIGDLRRRIKDLKDIWNVPIQDQYVDGKFKNIFNRLIIAT
jgi:hypothetical protein